MGHKHGRGERHGGQDCMEDAFETVCGECEDRECKQECTTTKAAELEAAMQECPEVEHKHGRGERHGGQDCMEDAFKAVCGQCEDRECKQECRTTKAAELEAATQKCAEPISTHTPLQPMLT